MFGRLPQYDLAPYRDELIVSTKAGYDMWPGPYGEWGRASTSCVARPVAAAHGLDYVDVFYPHRHDPETPLEETMGALHTVRPPGEGALRRDLVGIPPSGPAKPPRSWRSSGRR